VPLVIPISTTTITVWRAAADSGEETRDPYDSGQPADEAVYERIRANIASPSGRERNTGGSQEVVEFALDCDPIGLLHTDRVEDAKGQQYQVVWIAARTGFGLDHTRAGLRLVEGIA